MIEIFLSHKVRFLFNNKELPTNNLKENSTTLLKKKEIEEEELEDLIYSIIDEYYLEVAKKWKHSLLLESIRKYNILKSLGKETKLPNPFFNTKLEETEENSRLLLLNWPTLLKEHLFIDIQINKEEDIITWYLYFKENKNRKLKEEEKVIANNYERQKNTLRSSAENYLSIHKKELEEKLIKKISETIE